MSDITMIKPPRVAVAAEASAGHRVLGAARKDGAGITPPKAPIVGDNQRRAGGQFGASNGVQINRRGEAPVTKLAPQTLTVMQSTLASLIKFCKQEGATQAYGTALACQALVKTIAAGGSIADQPAPATPAPAKPAAPAAPAATSPTTPSSK